MVNYLNSLIEGASDAIFVAEIETGFITFANAAAGKLFDCLPSDLLGMHQTELHPKEEFDEIVQKFRYFTTSELYKETTAHILTQTGKRKLVLITGANMFELDGKKYASAYFKDISYVETLQQIAYDQSHLVRRPLANIMGISKLLKDNAISNEQERKYLIDELYNEATKLDDVVKHVTSKTLL